eukprot:snap_masked-scaffold_30-processed-gene-2.20-mRNA-1 protein AED:1.00 eAED:1.00 QI:0/0/0/0/1/1/2/0/262
MIYSFQRIGFLLRTHIGGIYIYIDHKALITVVRVKENNKRIYWDRLYRWIIRLQWDTDDAEDISKIAKCSWEVHLDEEYFKDKGELPLIIDSIGGSYLDADPVLFDNKDCFEVDFLNQDDALEYERSLIGRNFCARVNTTQNPLSPQSVYVHSNYSNVKDFLFTEHISYLSPFYSKKDKVEVNSGIKKSKQNELDEGYLSECDLVEGLYSFQSELLVPCTLLAQLLVKNGIDKRHPSLSFEKKSLSNIYIHRIPKGDLLSLL